MTEIVGAKEIDQQKVETLGDIGGITPEKDDIGTDHAQALRHEHLYVSGEEDLIAEKQIEKHGHHDTTTTIAADRAIEDPEGAGHQIAEIDTERRSRHEQFSRPALAFGSHATAFACNAFRSAFMYMFWTPG